MNKTTTAFINYCLENPNLRFWQAVANFSGYNFIYGSMKNVAQETQNNDLVDTYYFEGKDK